MRLLASLLWAAAACRAAENWDNILKALKIGPEFAANVLLPEQSQTLAADELERRVAAGALAIVEGTGRAARHFGVQPRSELVRVTGLVDKHDPKLEIIWKESLDVPVCALPEQAEIFTRDRTSGAPLMAGWRSGKGAILWLAVDPGPSGQERFPYLPQALRDLGLSPPAVSRRLWAFADTSYRLRADPEYLARKWRQAGISALHIAAWHYFEPDSARDEYLRRLIAACHKNLLLVYAWLELPHVSEQFWDKQPQWREKTATGADAHLDWRKLIDLTNPEATRAVKTGVEELLYRFDWDGVNLAELYFESLEGHHNPSRFTPMNANVREEFRRLAGFDPIDLFTPGGARHWMHNRDGLLAFLDYRAGLARRLQHEWIGWLEGLRRSLPHLDLVLTHVDNLLQPETRERIGADVKALLPVLAEHDFTLLVEDPATAWSLGPMRYPKLAAAYRQLTADFDRLAIDINVVERFQEVYPTKRQTGVELFRELHLAAQAFPRVAVYFENSILEADWPLVPFALAGLQALKREGERTLVEASAPIGLRWDGPAEVDGRVWPAAGDGWLWLPVGAHTVQATAAGPAFRLVDLNAELKSAWVSQNRLNFAYFSNARALAKLTHLPAQVHIDGEIIEPVLWVFDQEWVLVLPRGQHVVSVTMKSSV